MRVRGAIDLLNTEDSTDESEREEDEYEQQAAHYGSLVRTGLQRLPQTGPDLETLVPGEENDPYLSGGSGWASGVGGGGGPGGDWAAAPRRLYFCGFGPTLTAWDIYKFLAKFGPVEAFRLYTDPVTSLSLRAAGVVYEHAGDAQRALEAAQEGMVYLANVWAPEAQMVSDPGGEVAQSQYETVVQQPVPALQPPPTAVVRGYGTGAGGAAAGGGVNQQLQSQQQPPPPQDPTAEWGRCTRLFVSNLPQTATAMGVKTTFAHFGFVSDYCGAHPPRPPKRTLAGRRPRRRPFARRHSPRACCEPRGGGGGGGACAALAIGARREALAWLDASMWWGPRAAIAQHLRAPRAVPFPARRRRRRVVWGAGWGEGGLHSHTHTRCVRSHAGARARGGVARGRAALTRSRARVGARVVRRAPREQRSRPCARVRARLLHARGRPFARPSPGRLLPPSAATSSSFSSARRPRSLAPAPLPSACCSQSTATPSAARASGP